MGCQRRTPVTQMAPTTPAKARSLLVSTLSGYSPLASGVLTCSDCVIMTQDCEHDVNFKASRLGALGTSTDQNITGIAGLMCTHNVVQRGTPRAMHWTPRDWPWGGGAM